MTLASISTAKSVGFVEVSQSNIYVKIALLFFLMSVVHQLLEPHTVCLDEFTI